LGGNRRGAWGKPDKKDLGGDETRQAAQEENRRAEQ